MIPPSVGNVAQLHCDFNDVLQSFGEPSALGYAGELGCRASRPDRMLAAKTARQFLAYTVLVLVVGLL